MKAKERIYQYLNFKGISPTKAESMLSWGKGALTKQSSISVDKLEEFFLLFPDLSAEWLMRGEGEMLRANTTQESESAVKFSGEFEIDEKGFLRVKLKK